MITLTIVILSNGSLMDIMVRPDQRVIEVLEVLAQNGKIPGINIKNRISVRSWRKGGFINPYNSFRQDNVFNGDILYISSEVSQIC